MSRASEVCVSYSALLFILVTLSHYSSARALATAPVVGPWAKTGHHVDTNHPSASTTADYHPLTSTPLLQDWLGDDAAKRHRREIHFPSGRFGEAIELARAVVFLASEESSFVNGQDFVVDGGMTKVCFFCSTS